jgi:hypothetical protein
MQLAAVSLAVQRLVSDALVASVLVLVPHRVA